MFGVLSKLTLAAALVCGPLLVQRCAAQQSDEEFLTAQEALRAAGDVESIEAGMAEPADDEPGYLPNEDERFLTPGEFLADEDMAGLSTGCVGWDEEGESLFPDGLLQNPGPIWYATAQVTLLQRQRPNKTIISTQREFVFVSGTPILITPPVMSTRQFTSHVEPGMRLTVGRNLYQDVVDRQHAIEFTFLGLNHWSTHAEAVGKPGSAAGNVIIFNNLFSNFPISTGGFNAASLHQIFSTSRMNNYEMNYRISRLPRNDRIAMQPDGSWRRVGTPSMTWSLLAGARVVTFQDNFLWLSNGVYGPGQDFAGIYNIRTANTLGGGQIGGDIGMDFNVFYLGMRSRAGIYSNLAKQHSELTIVDPLFGNTSPTSRSSAAAPAFVGDLGFTGTAKIRRWAYLRASYDFMWVGGLANAPEQVHYLRTLQNNVRTNGHLLFQGVSLGMDFVW